MLSAVAILTGLFAAIFFHEAAHFATAKAFGMKVTEFFAGFGPRLWSFRRGETEYGVKLFLPLGGYVKITGMSPMEEIDAAEEHRTYRGSPFWQKSIVVLAGVAAIFVLAFLIFYAVFTLLGINQQDFESRVGTVIEELGDGTVSPAASADLEVGDLIVAIDGVPTQSWGDVLDGIAGRAGDRLQLDIQRDGISLTAFLVPAEVTAEGVTRGFVGIGRPDPINVRTVRSGPIEGLGDAADIYVVSITRSIEAVGTLLWPPNLLDLFSDAVGGRDPGEERPITVVGLVGESSNIFDATGWAGIMSLIAGLNIIVALFNVLPLFPLDGGHFAVAVYEKLRGRPVDVEKLVPLAVGVIMFFISIFLLGLWFDLFGPGLNFG